MATNMHNNLQKMNIMFKVAWSNKFNEKAYVDRRRISRRNTSGDNK